MPERKIVLFGCGDIGPVHEPVADFSALAAPILAEADIRFGQCERVYSDRGALQIHSGGAHSRVPPHMSSVFSDCGFDVVSMASNHAMDWGADAMLDTRDNLRARGIQTVGAGRNLDEARQPAIIERNGVRVAFLAYCTVLRDGYPATETQPGAAPLRAHTYYEPLEYQAGMPPRVVTIPHEGDLAAMIADIKAAKKSADVVVLSLHWGLHFIPRAIADHQPVVAKAAFAAGADLILGGHAHAPKAIEVMDGKVCFYSLSNFIMSAPEASPNRKSVFEARFGTALDPEYPNLPYGMDAKRSLIAKAVLSKGGADSVSFLPLLIDTQLRPEVLRNGDPRFDDAVSFMEWVSEGFNHRFVVDQDEVGIVPG